MRTVKHKRPLQLRLDDSEEFAGQEWYVHDPETTNDSRVLYADGRPVEPGNFKTADRIVRRQNPGRDVVLVC